MKIEFKIEVGTEFSHEFCRNMVICYDFYNRKYWCKYDTMYGYQFHWVTEGNVKKAIQSQNKDYDVVFV